MCEALENCHDRGGRRRPTKAYYCTLQEEGEAQRRAWQFASASLAAAEADEEDPTKAGSRPAAGASDEDNEGPGNLPAPHAFCWSPRSTVDICVFKILIRTLLSTSNVINLSAMP